jgi:ADP-ribose pyrophosphatase
MVGGAPIAGDPTVDFFFYGTLRDADVRRAVLGPAADALAVAPARLAGYRCAPVAGGRFPVLVPEAGASAEGVVVDGVGLVAAARTSFFEDDGYDYGVTAVAVETAVDGARQAWAFLSTGRLTPGPGRWSIELWRRQHRTAFVANARRAMARCRGMALDGYVTDWRRRLAAG